MKVACFVNPLVQARGPCFNFGWVETLANLLQPLRRDARCECMLIAGGWFKDWARQNQKGALLTGLRTVWIDELALYRRLRALGELPTALDQTAYQADDAAPGAACHRGGHGAGRQRLRAGHHHRICRPSQLPRQTVAVRATAAHRAGTLRTGPLPVQHVFRPCRHARKIGRRARRRAEAAISLDVGWTHAGVGISLADGSRLRRPGSIPDPDLAQRIRSTVPASAAGLERVCLRRTGQLPYPIR